MFTTVSDELVRLEEPGHRYYVGEGITEKVVPSLSHLIKSGGLGASYEGIDPDVLARKARIGTALHLAIEYVLVRDDDPELENCIEPGDDILDRVREYYESFLRWLDGKSLQADYFEHPAFQPDLGYACTVDFVGTVDGAPWVLDYKTTVKVAKATAVQLIGQRLCYKHPAKDEVQLGVLWMLRGGKAAKIVPMDKIVKLKPAQVAKTLTSIAHLESVRSVFA